MTTAEKETYLILRGWQQSETKAFTVNISFTIDKNDDKNVHVDEPADWTPVGVTVSWYKDEHSFKTVDEAIEIEGYIK